MDGGDLERRALAAAAEARAQAEARAREEKRLKEEEERREREKEERQARRGATRKLKEVLGYETSPSDWGIWTGSTPFHRGGPFRSVTYHIRTWATLNLMGVDIRGNEDDLQVYTVPGKSWGSWAELDLVSFGRALENRPPAEAGEAGSISGNTDESGA